MPIYLDIYDIAGAHVWRRRNGLIRIVGAVIGGGGGGGGGAAGNNTANRGGGSGGCGGRIHRFEMLGAYLPFEEVDLYVGAGGLGGAGAVAGGAAAGAGANGEESYFGSVALNGRKLISAGGGLPGVAGTTTAGTSVSASAQYIITAHRVFGAGTNSGAGALGAKPAAIGPNRAGAPTPGNGGAGLASGSDTTYDGGDGCPHAMTAGSGNYLEGALGGAAAGVLAGLNGLNAEEIPHFWDYGGMGGGGGASSVTDGGAGGNGGRGGGGGGGGGAGRNNGGAGGNGGAGRIFVLSEVEA